MRFRPHALILVAVFAVACSDSTAPAITLTDEEVALLFQEITSAAGGADAPVALRANLVGATSNVTTTTTTSADCPGGGRVAVSASFSQPSSTAITITGTETFTACRTEHFTVGGSLHLAATINQPNDSTFTIQETLKGTLDVTHVDGRKGSCPIDVAVSLSSSGAAFDASATGTVCGRSAETAVTITG